MRDLAMRAMTVLRAALLLLPGLAALAGAAGAAPRPNFVLVLADDMRASDLAFMPLSMAQIAGKGLRFERAYVETALCAPSRASILTGRHAHNSGVRNNDPLNGGFWQYRDRGLDRESFPYWLRSLGYETALVGKFLNGYGGTAADNIVPAGWTYWFARRDTPDPHRNLNYGMVENGRVVSFDGAATSYATDVYLRKAKDFLKAATARRRPFFLMLNVHAPHGPADPAPRHAQLFVGAQVPRTPSFLEPDMSDKPTFFQTTLAADRVALMDAYYRRRLQALQAVDEAVRDLVTTLTVTGQLANTYIILMSDNGFHLGEHQRYANKELAYEEDIHVPIMLRGPQVPEGAVDSRHLVMNVDIAPTIAALAGYGAPVNVDGRSLVPLWTRADANALPWRQVAGAARWIWDNPAKDTYGTNTYKALRSDRYTWIEWSDGQRELYDNLTDPWQLQNIAAATGNNNAGFRQRLAERTAALASCAAQTCIDAENLPAPMP